MLAAKLIAEIGDVRRFHYGKALISYTGIDAPPHQSGQFTTHNKRISKRGSVYQKKIDMKVMQGLKTHSAPYKDSVYPFILKKMVKGNIRKLRKLPN